MKRLFIVWFASALFAANCAYGDGGVIPATAFAKVEIPDQRALIHYSNGVETLVIDTAFKGEGTNFAWIVPVPSEPKVEAATTGLFTTLQFIFRPKVIHNVTRYYWGAIILGVFLFTLIRSFRRGRSFTDILGMWLLLLLLAGLLLPALSTAGSGSASGVANVNVLDRKRVGIYDTATLSSRDGGALLSWLGQNGFKTPTNFVPAIQAYAQEGWYFVASKIALDVSSKDPTHPHPLSFTFRTQRPVYPLRLTAIGNEKCRIDLYVFGSGRAEVPGFTVERCAQPMYPDISKDNPYWPPGPLRIRHPLLRKLVDQSPVATKLTGELSNAQMQQDAYVAWTPFQEKINTFYSNRGAAVLAADIAVPLLVIGLLILYTVKGVERNWAGIVRRFARGAAMVALIVGPIIYLALPKTPAALTILGTRLNARQHSYISGLLKADIANESNERTNMPPVDLAWVRRHVGEKSEFRKTYASQFSRNNPFFDRPLHEEDSPGNYTIRQVTEGFEYVWYDMDGGEFVRPLFRGRE